MQENNLFIRAISWGGGERKLCLLQRTKSLPEVPQIFKHKFRNSLLLWTMPAVRSQTLLKCLAEELAEGGTERNLGEAKFMIII